MLSDCSRIVVPYDQSPLSKRALEMAILLAKQEERVELNVITVVNKVIPLPFYVGVDLEKEFEAQHEIGRQILNGIDERLNVLKNRTKTFILVGDPTEMIINFVRPNDFIIMGSRGLSGLKEMFLGSVSHNVVQKSPCPVLIVK